MARRTNKAVAAAVPKQVSLKTLAEHLGLSPTTISLVLNESPVAATIPLVTRDRVFAAAREFNYRPNPLARSLRLKRTHTIGIIAPEHSEGYFTSLMNAIESYLIGAGYLYFTVSHFGKPDLLKEYTRLLMSRHVDGLLLINTHLDEELPVPTVAISSHSPFPSVTNILLDHKASAEITLRHLYDLGHRRIVYMKGQPDSLDAEPRWQALMACARDLKLPVDNRHKLIVDHNSWTPDLGYPLVYDLLGHCRDFTAVLCFNDHAAIGAIRAIADRGLRCPEDISVIGFDDVASAAYSIPRLTTVRQPLARMGETAARLLIEAAEKKSDIPAVLEFRPELMFRESTAPPKASSESSEKAGKQKKVPTKRI